MSAKAGKSISGKFNVLVVDMNIFHVFGIVEKYIDALLFHENVPVKVKNMIAQLSKLLNMQPEIYVRTYSTNVWLLLSINSI